MSQTELKKKFYIPRDSDIQFDEHERPYIKSPHGRIMLSMRKEPHYTMKNK